MNDQEFLDDAIDLYNEQYINAIILLIDRENFEETIIPLINLIFQYVENNLKNFLQDYFELKKTSKDLKLKTHNCESLIELLMKKYDKYQNGIVFQSIINPITEYISYLKLIMGNNVLINSRYPIKLDKLEISYNNLSIDKYEFDIRTKELITSINHFQYYYTIEKIYDSFIKFSINLEEDKIKLIEEFAEAPISHDLTKNIIEEIFNCNK